MTPARRRKLVSRLQNRDYRQAYFESHIDSSIAAQIKANRERRDLSQKQLAKKAGLFQSQISKMEDVNHDRWTAKTLRRIARALDLVLVIRFEAFSKALAIREAFPGNLVQAPFAQDNLTAKPQEAAPGRQPTPGAWAAATGGGPVSLARHGFGLHLAGLGASFEANPFGEEKAADLSFPSDLLENTGNLQGRAC